MSKKEKLKEVVKCLIQLGIITNKNNNKQNIK